MRHKFIQFFGYITFEIEIVYPIYTYYDLILIDFVNLFFGILGS
jgi:hypothetical protein